MAKQKIIWRYCRKPGDTALTAQQIAQLSVDFSLPAEDLARLSERLTWALGPHNRPRSIIHALEAGPKGRSVFTDAVRGLSRARAGLKRVHSKLRSLSISTPVGEDRYESGYQHLFALLLQAIANVELVEKGFLEAKAAGMRREVRDLPVRGGSHRRTSVHGVHCNNILLG